MNIHWVQKGSVLASRLEEMCIFFSARNEMTSSVCVGSKNQKQELYEYIMCPHCFDTKY
jgi:hypothetical protein